MMTRYHDDIDVQLKRSENDIDRNIATTVGNTMTEDTLRFAFPRLLDDNERYQPAQILARLPPEVNRVLYVRNLPFKISSEELYDIFGKYGAIRQIRLGTNNDTRGTAFVVYEDIYDAKNAVDHLSGFNVCGRYLIVLYYQANKMQQRPTGTDLNQQKKELQDLKDKYGVE
ncbi:Splicing factor 3B subunit 6 [Phytophthora boehmeriae]|uniref:Splicing factor 3B subunit 6 n=1 Tax=Phytophthora boehmeriae TaxID=109152 RepID=A0A8T1VL86_9STRA|nr:Splicing factor 3B subunit 6 [Phytophthora boehmeriae]